MLNLKKNNEKIVPNCRYGHGDLQKLRTAFGGEWGLVSTEVGSDVLFSGDIYVCATCGYTEMFDPEPQRTLSGEVAEGIFILPKDDNLGKTE